MPANASPLSRLVLVTSIPQEGMECVVVVSAPERAALAEASGLVSIDELSGTFDLQPRSAGKGVNVRGEVVATVVQTCTVTLDPFESELTAPVDLTFMPEESVDVSTRRHDTKPSEEHGLADEDPPDLIENGRIDLGRITAEFLVLSLDPYPRKPGVTFDAERYGVEANESPFAALAQLKKAQ